LKDVPNQDYKNIEDNICNSKDSHCTSDNISENEKRLIERENIENKSVKSENRLLNSVNIRPNKINLDKINNNTIKIKFNGDAKNININCPEVLVNTLKDAIDDTNKQYKILRREFIDEIKKKSESQQLLQKCIEDLKLEISLSSKDLQCFSKKFLTSFLILLIF